MIINRIWNLTELIVIILTILTSILCEQQERQQSLDQLFHIVTSLRRFHSQKCQFKFENCIQDLSYANQLDTECNVYSHLRDCFRSLLDESQCLSHQLKHQYNEAKKHEYEACGSISSYESVRSSWYTSSSSKLSTTYLTTLILFVIIIS